MAEQIAVSEELLKDCLEALEACQWTQPDEDASIGICHRCGVPEYEEHRPTCKVGNSIKALKELLR